MKKVLLFLLFSTLIYSQNIKVTYSVLIEDPKIVSSDFEKEMLEKTHASVNNNKPYLLCNTTESVFKLENNAIVENDLVKVLILGNKQKVYTDLEKKLNYIESENKKFSITDSVLLDWQITTESKMINNLKCFKATQIHKYTNNRLDENGNLKYFTNNITAWYAPEISYNFGPRGFCGLPGLIVELHYDDILYGLHKIEFNVTEKIETINKQKTISQIEYEKMYMQEMQEKLKLSEKK